MEFYLPEVFSDSQVNLYREKEVFMEHYLKLEKQRFLHSMLLEFKAQLELLQVMFFVVNEGKDLDADLTFAQEFDPEEGTNYWEAQSVSNAMRSAYVPELEKFCDGKTLKRSDLLGEDGEPRFAHIDKLLDSIESS
jgi:hypothetical protein